MINYLLPKRVLQPQNYKFTLASHVMVDGQDLLSKGRVDTITIAILGIVEVMLIQSTCSDKARYSIQARLYLCLILC